MAALGRIAFLLGCQLTNMPFMLSSGVAAAEEHVPAHPGSARRRAPCPSSPARRSAASATTWTASPTSMITFNDLIASTVFAVVALVDHAAASTR